MQLQRMWGSTTIALIAALVIVAPMHIGMHDDFTAAFAAALGVAGLAAVALYHKDTVAVLVLVADIAALAAAAFTLASAFFMPALVLVVLAGALVALFAFLAAVTAQGESIENKEMVEHSATLFLTALPGVGTLFGGATILVRRLASWQRRHFAKPAQAD